MPAAKLVIARWIHPLVVGAVVVAMALAEIEVSAQETPQATAATYTVQGVVLNKLTGEPVARALVSAGSDAAFTDQAGHFILKVAEGQVLISVIRPGYGGVGNMGGQASKPHTVAVSANTPDQTFNLTPNAEITAHVTVANGDDPSDFRFQVYSRQIVDHRRKWIVSSIATADSEGAVRLANLSAPASYLICNIHKMDTSRMVAVGAVERGYVAACFPGGTDFGLATPLTLAPGQKAEVDISLIKKPFYPASITVENIPQGPSPNLRIHDTDGRSFSAREDRDEATGIRTVKMPNGRYYATSEVQQGKESWYGRVDFKVNGAPVTGLSITLQRVRPITVKIHKDYTAPEIVIKDASGTPIKNTTGGMLRLSHAENTLEMDPGTVFRHVEGSSDEELFQTESSNVEPGRYWVYPRIELATGYISEMTSGGRDLISEPLVVGAGGVAAPIEITLRNDGGEIEVTVNKAGTSPAAISGSAEKPGYQIYAIPESSSAMASLSEQLTSPIAFYSGSGPFSLSNLAPGVYSVVAFDSPPEIDMHDAELLARIAAKGKTVTVTAGGTAKVQVDVIPTAAEEAQ